MDWIPFQWIRFLSKYGLGILIALWGTVVVWIFKKRVAGKIPPLSIRLKIALGLILFLSIVYACLDSNGGLTISDNLFTDFYYVGDVKTEGAVGKGRQFAVEGYRLVYSGGFRDNRRTNGKLYYENGDYYVGPFEEDEPHGAGMLFLKNGNRYKGTWEHGERQGPLTYYYRNGDRYEGAWLDDNPNGEGTYYYAGKGLYKGDFLDGQKHGEGTYDYTNGDFYDGQWEKDKKHGYGMYDYAEDGSHYYGEWADGKREGYGVMNYANGDRYEGYWADDMLNGEGVYYYANGTKEQREYQNDKRIR